MPDTTPNLPPFSLVSPVAATNTPPGPVHRPPRRSLIVTRHFPATRTTFSRPRPPTRRALLPSALDPGRPGGRPTAPSTQAPLDNAPARQPTTTTPRPRRAADRSLDPSPLRRRPGPTTDHDDARPSPRRPTANSPATRRPTTRRPDDRPRRRLTFAPTADDGQFDDPTSDHAEIGPDGRPRRPKPCSTVNDSSRTPTRIDSTACMRRPPSDSPR